MSRPETLCSWDKVSQILGGSQETAKLLDPNRDGMPLDELKLLAMQRGATRVLMSYGVQNDISTLREPYDLSLQHLAQDASAIEAWIIGTGGQSLPDLLKDIDARLDKALELLKETKLSPAQNPEAPNQHLITEVLPDTDSTYGSGHYTRYSLGNAGFT